MVFKPSDEGDFPQFAEYKPFIERLVDGLTSVNDADRYKARVRAAVALGLLPETKLAEITPATLEMDTVYLYALQIRQIFTCEPLEMSHHPDPEPSPPGSYRHVRRGSGGIL